ncbi:histidinol phosphate phosphatase [Formicincola oecophyllae]|uniref:Histidinol phosphate phosphatase n=1 Tax=Formicincola oecophyllae TaxID=2558361 RepID=A0A4Y6U9T1_9PROT|nr:inositol monophosphatase family protein [Formicincola oecophyllae]QDH13964.1 histidinol phosphate phosphatase [Formicincola oecophyllae]
MPDDNAFAAPPRDILERALRAAHYCADEAARHALPLFRKPLQAEVKQDGSPVTVADKAAEEAMRAHLAQAFPNHAVLGEESGLAQGAHGAPTTPATMAEWLWVLDPIDGTRAFLTGRPSFCTLVALLHHGRPVLGLVDQPVTGERWHAVLGGPTHYASSKGFPGTVGTRQGRALGQAELSCTAPEIIAPANQAAFKALQNQAARMSWGGDAYAYGLLALGQLDLIAEDTMKPWDWAALAPVVEGAGGVMSDWQGRPLTFTPQKGDQSGGTVLAAANPTLHKQAVEALGAHPMR